jgi:hypothetical protein
LKWVTWDVRVHNFVLFSFLLFENFNFLFFGFHSVIRAGLHPLDLEVGKWLRRHAPGIKPVVAMNKSESLFDGSNSLKAAADEVHRLGFGDPIAISAETGLGMTELYQALKPMLEDYMLQVLNGKQTSFPKRICHSTLKIGSCCKLRISFNIYKLCLTSMKVL